LSGLAVVGAGHLVELLTRASRRGRTFALALTVNVYRGEE